MVHGELDTKNGAPSYLSAMIRHFYPDRKSRGAAEFTWGILNFQKDQDIRLKVGSIRAKGKWHPLDSQIPFEYCYDLRECLKLIPHEKFSFAKIWLLAAQFEIQQLNLKGARLILGNAIGKAPKDKVI
ncbi:Pre-mRNA-splicing factor clf1 [Camellia lanceoleosa]|uniref:Pre-mRNA-splicing factor clf1 n=1 Tax=Camellia lanceoleosa TaxID=1840588 RepID=A0ACC0GJE9_9ERIC|nr:Pre-mRNA-splicing factor clf1 [Camellia lanceoleosa]